MVGQYPANSSHSSWCSDDTIQGDLTNLNKSHSSTRGVDHEVIENILVGIYKERILPR